MEVVNVNIPYKSRGDEYTFAPIGDVHYENIACDEKQFRESIKELTDEPNTYVWTMGDLLDCIKHDDKRYDYMHLNTRKAMDRLGIMTSIKSMVKILQPLADKGRLIGMMSGNHEETIRKRHEEEVMQWMAHELDVPWLTYACFINLKFSRGTGKTASRQLFKVYSTHGYGGGRKVGGKVNKLLALSEGYDADIYCMAHDHILLDYLDTTITSKSNGKGLLNKYRNYAYTGTFLKTHKMGYITYPESGGYNPTAIGYMKIKITPDKRNVVMEKVYI